MGVVPAVDGFPVWPGTVTVLVQLPAAQAKATTSMPRIDIAHFAFIDSLRNPLCNAAALMRDYLH